ncbi:MAG: hypothetical protein IPH12_07015 [Saprospirales bacterium]|nr:hypothetical protein [Saprospirales bacterium]
MKKIVPVLALFLLLSANLLAQVPQKLSWQAILRDDAGKPITAPVELLFTILDGNTAVFEEEKALTPNAFGLAVWNIGEKETAAFQAINWEGGPKRLKVAMRTTIGFGNFIDIGTESLRSVPYALVAEKVLQDQDNQNLTINGPSLSISGGNAVALPDASPTNELQTLSLSGANLTLSNGGGTVVLPAGKDTSATNELQTLSLAGADLSLSNGGGAVTLPDASATNEIQTITLSGPDIILSNSGGAVTLPDPSATNELQTLSLTGQTLALSNGGGTVTLPAGTAYTAGSGININGGVISNAGDEDNNPSNEIQALSLTGQTLTLSNGGGAVTLPTYNAGSGININGNVISNAGDADNNPANEIQALSLSGPTLALSNGGGAVTLPDASATNELQTLSLSGADLTLSNSGGAVTLPDTSATNELQTLSLTGQTLTLSNGGGAVTLPDTSSTNEIQALALSGDTLRLSNGGGAVVFPPDGDVSALNEIQALSQTADTLRLSNGGGFVVLKDTSAVNELQQLVRMKDTLSLTKSSGFVVLKDTSSTNEIQALSLSGQTLSLSKGGGAVTLPTGAGYQPGTGIYSTATSSMHWMKTRPMRCRRCPYLGKPCLLQGAIQLPYPVVTGP